jgi:hypothetical protein
MTQTPLIACTLSPEELLTRRKNLLPGLAAQAEQITSIPNGVELRMPSSPDSVTAIARVVDAERGCCRFLGFAITVEPNLGPITLTITAPPEAQALLAGLVARSDVN